MNRDGTRAQKCATCVAMVNIMFYLLHLRKARLFSRGIYVVVCCLCFGAGCLDECKVRKVAKLQFQYMVLLKLIAL